MSLLKVSWILITLAASVYGNSLDAGKLNEFIATRTSALELLGIAGKKAFFRDATNTTTTLAGYIKFCNDNQMHMATVENAKESDVITNYMTATNYNFMLWLGGWDPTRSRVFRWMSSCQPFAYTNWDVNWSVSQPQGDGDCTFIANTTYNRGKWHDVPCQRSYMVPLCQLTLP